MTELILIRHGETEWNARRRIQGQLDVPLNDVGRAQAEAIGLRFISESVDVLISSDLSRAMQTMQSIANVCGLGVLTDCGLRERKLGLLEGLYYEEAQRKLPHLLDVFQGRQIDTPLDGGESLREFSKRVIDTLDAIVNEHQGKRIIAVTHGGVIDVAHRYASGAPLDEPRTFAIHNTSVSTFNIDEAGLSLVEEADASHLASRDILDNA